MTDVDVRGRLVTHLPTGAAAMMLTASALALSSGAALANCAPAGNNSDQNITCDANGGDTHCTSACLYAVIHTEELVAIEAIDPFGQTLIMPDR